MEPQCEKPVEGWGLIVLTLLTVNIYNPVDSKKSSKSLILNIFSEVLRRIIVFLKEIRH